METRASGVVLRERWGFAASAASCKALRHALDQSAEYVIMQKTPSTEAVAQMRAASEGVARLVETGLWGSGPFSVTLTGSENDFFLSVKQT